MNESMLSRSLKIFGDKACHPERSEGSGSPAAQILRCAQDDMQDTARGRSLEIFSPNIYARLRERAELDQRADASLFLTTARALTWITHIWLLA